MTTSSRLWPHMVGSLRNCLGKEIERQYATLVKAKLVKSYAKKGTIMTQSYTTTFTVDQTPEEAFAAITNVRGWWSGEIEGSTDTLGDEFTYRHKDVHYSKQRITELIPDKKVVWLVLDAQLNFVKDKTEWTNTEITFEISEKGDQTEIHFTHLGLVSEFECFDSCSNAWGFYINGSLRSLITTGKAQPNQEEKADVEKASR
ncbi:MAG: SRPBCC domain-containing protein [Roseiflexaceae bacterium]